MAASSQRVVICTRLTVAHQAGNDHSDPTDAPVLRDRHADAVRAAVATVNAETVDVPPALGEQIATMLDGSADPWESAIVRIGRSDLGAVGQSSYSYSVCPLWPGCPDSYDGTR